VVAQVARGGEEGRVAVFDAAVARDVRGGGEGGVKQRPVFVVHCKWLIFVYTIILIRVSYDQAKREWTLLHRGLDFEDAALVFQGLTVEIEDKRKDYGERRMICFGLLQGRLVVVGYTPRGSVRHVFSMRKANDREQARLAPYFEL
jgi:uncharacterized DUF497 family protein